MPHHPFHLAQPTPLPILTIPYHPTSKQDLINTVKLLQDRGFTYVTTARSLKPGRFTIRRPTKPYILWQEQEPDE